MSLIVQKFGGTSLADVCMIRRVAGRIIKAYDYGNDVVTVLSAMSGVTDSLIKLAYEISDCPDKRELDVLLATGEQLSVSILTMMLKQLGYKAQSVVSHQIGILTDSSYGDANIINVDIRNIKSLLKKRIIAVVAGFQGCDDKGNITTLGRGGSDTSAVVLAGALNADTCEIYTDVDGIYTADPNLCSKAKKFKKISYNDMFHMAKLGTKVLQKDSIVFAKKHNIVVHVRSSFSFEEGTIVMNNSFQRGNFGVIGIAYDLNYGSIKIRDIPDKFNIKERVLDPIIDAGISLDIVEQHKKSVNYTDIFFTVDKENFSKALKIEKKISKSIKSMKIIGDLDSAKISIVGIENVNMKILLSLLSELKKKEIEPVMNSITKRNFICVVKGKYLKEVVELFHSILKLD